METANAAVANVTEKIKSIGMGKQTIVMTLLVVGAVSLVIAYALYYMINNYVLSKQAYQVPGTSVPVMGNILTKTVISTVPLSNGQRAAISFWIYINDIEKYKGSLRHVLHVGDDNVVNGSPIVWLGSNDNKLYVAFAPNGGVTQNANDTLETTMTKQVTTSGIVIDYIPIQRWVHVAIVVNEDVNGGSMYAYVDSELVKSVSTGDVLGSATGSSSLQIQNLNLAKGGSIYMGGSTSDVIGPGFSGLLAKVKFYNYDLNVGDVYNEYKAGPIDNLLAKLGLPAYGVRSPLYRVG